MKISMDRSHSLEMRCQHMKQGVDDVRSRLLLEIHCLEENALSTLIKCGMGAEDAAAFRARIAENRKTMSNNDTNMNYADDNSVAKVFVSEIRYYADMTRTYAWALATVQPDPEERERCVSEGFKKLIEHINFMSLGYLSSMTALLPEGPGTANLKKWSEKRKMDRFGFDAASDSLEAALAVAKCPSEGGVLWGNRLTTLAATMNDIMCDHTGKFILCLSAYAKASAGLYDDAVSGLRPLVEACAAEEAERLLRTAPSVSTKQEGFKDEDQRVFAERMSHGIVELRAFMSTKAREKEERNYVELEKLGMDKEALEELKGRVAGIESAGAEAKRRLERAMDTVLANPEDQTLLNVMLKKVARFDAISYAVALTSYSATDMSKFRGRMLKGMEEISAFVLPRREENIESAIESLGGRVAEADLSKIADWFGIRRRKKFEFERQGDYIERVLSIGNTDEIVSYMAGEVAVPLFSYMLSLEACSNAASGRSGPALDSLMALKAFDLTNISFYINNAYVNHSLTDEERRNN